MGKSMVPVDRYVLRAALLRMVATMVDMVAGHGAPADTMLQLRRTMTLAVEEAVREVPHSFEK